jgi:hypothetical protein
MHSMSEGASVRVKPEDVENMTYDEALAALIANPHTTYLLRQRLREDGQRNTGEALHDAELLVALLRVQAKHELPKQAGAGS